MLGFLEASSKRDEAPEQCMEERIEGEMGNFIEYYSMGVHQLIQGCYEGDTPLQRSLREDLHELVESISVAVLVSIYCSVGLSFSAIPIKLNFKELGLLYGVPLATQRPPTDIFLSPCEAQSVGYSSDFLMNPSQGGHLTDEFVVGIYKKRRQEDAMLRDMQTERLKHEEAR
ncbi:hypothetical protein B484DRAFT_409965 [Ochromonadaceae sp. CCMP2298]|nr:hypothetical protein B484DRAFT_409965 [Ochromonadaceae sp. CCMP2298]